MRFRSALFAPATRPLLVSKLGVKGADVAVIDLEDAVPPSMKVEARGLVADTFGREGRGDSPTFFVRINAPDSPWWRDDLDLVAELGLSTIVVPKAGTRQAIDTVAEAARERGITTPQLMLGIETVIGVLDLRSLLHDAVVAFYFGAEDYVTDLGGVRSAEGLEVLWPRSYVAAVASAHGIPALDQVVTELDDEQRFLEDARVGRGLGYAAKLCIHPSQVPLAQQVFSPSVGEIDHSRRLIAAWEQSAEAGVGAFQFEGAMVDAPAVSRAERVLRAGLDLGSAT